MLVLSRKINQSIMIGDDIEIQIVEIKGDHVKIGVNAPKSITVHRKEVYEEIKQENKKASVIKADSLKNIQDLLKKKPLKTQ